MTKTWASDLGSGVTFSYRRLYRKIEEIVLGCRTDVIRPGRVTQYQEDVAWLKRKLMHLQEQLEREPDRIQQRYTLRSVRIFPLEVLCLLPRNMVK